MTFSNASSCKNVFEKLRFVGLVWMASLTGETKLRFRSSPAKPWRCLRFLDLDQPISRLLLQALLVICLGNGLSMITDEVRSLFIYIKKKLCSSVSVKLKHYWLFCFARVKQTKKNVTVYPWCRKYTLTPWIGAIFLWVDSITRTSELTKDICRKSCRLVWLKWELSAQNHLRSVTESPSDKDSLLFTC